MSGDHGVGSRAMALSAIRLGMALAAIWLGTGFGSEGQRAVPARPNILLILADDLGWSDLGCYGGEIHTPQLDALARGGLRFSQFYNSARCCPTRASLLTGLYPHQAGVGAMTNDRGPQHPGYRGTLAAHTVTLAEALHSVGYRTYMVGKWHLHNSLDIKPTDRGFDEFYGMLGGFNSFWVEQPYYTRWPKGRPLRPYTSARGEQRGTFYSTDVFADYALDFLADARKRGGPFFLYLAFNAPHFPLHAPEEDIARYEAMYWEKGWDTIRQERLARQKALGVIPPELGLPPRSLVPPKMHARSSPYAGQENPAWASLPAARRRDLARRMAVYAAMVERMDAAVGRVVQDLKRHRQLDQTLILFLSDNGACWEWDPLGFDENSGPKNILHEGDELYKVGGPASYISYGSGWANACNTPWRMYKHFCFEGGIRTPLIVHWPAGLKGRDEWRLQAGHIVDLMPTLLEVSGASYPPERQGVKTLPLEGVSLLPAFQNQPLRRKAPLFFEHEGSRAVRDGRWKLVSLSGDAWELYDLETDPAEQRNVAAAQPEKVRQLAALWEVWAERCHVDTGQKAAEIRTPRIARCPLRIRCVVETTAAHGVILAQGGRQQGYALHLDDGHPVFSVRIDGTLFAIQAPQTVSGRFALEAELAPDGRMRLWIDGKEAAAGRAKGLIPVEPQDELSVGEDTRTAVGNYQPPHPLAGKVSQVEILTR